MKACSLNPWTTKKFPSAHFLIGYLFYWYWIACAVCIFVDDCVWEYFLSFCGLPFDFMVSFVVRMLLILIRFSFVYYCFYLYYSWRWIQKDIAAIFVKEWFSCFSKSFIGPWWILNLFLYVLFKNVLISFVYMQVSNFPCATYWRDSFLSIV